VALRQLVQLAAHDALPDNAVGLVSKAQLSDGDREKLTFGNASRLFKISMPGG